MGELAGRWLSAQQRKVALGDSKAFDSIAQLDALALSAGPLLGRWLRTHSLYLTRFVGVDTIAGMLKTTASVAVDEKLIALEQQMALQTKLQVDVDAEVTRLMSARVKTRRIQSLIDQKAAYAETVRKGLDELRQLHRNVVVNMAKPFSAFCDYLVSKVMLKTSDEVYFWVALNENDLLVFRCNQKDLTERTEVVMRMVDGGRRVVAIVLETDTVVPDNSTSLPRLYTMFPLPKSVLLTVGAPPSELIGQQIWKLPNENLDPDWWAILTLLAVLSESSCRTYEPDNVSYQVILSKYEYEHLPHAFNDVKSFEVWNLIRTGVLLDVQIPIFEFVKTLQNKKHLMVKQEDADDESQKVYF